MHFNAHLDVDVVALEQDDTVTVMLELQAPTAETEVNRAAHTVVVSLDRSGSMAGPRLFAAKAALLGLIDRLDPRDQLGVIAFDDAATTVLPARPLGDLGTQHARAAVSQIDSGGMTDLSSGYLRALQEARRAAGPTGATVVLLSDGQANSGLTDDVALKSVSADALGKGITTATIGIGLGYDETILTAIAEGGAGNHSFAERPEAAATALAGEIDGLLSKTVQAASLIIRPVEGISGISLLNDLPAVGGPDGLHIDIGDFYGGEGRRLVLEMTVPGRDVLGLLTIAELELRYVELPRLVEHVVRMPLSVNVLPGDEAAGRVRKPEVEREKLLLSVQSAKQRGEDALRDGDRDAARKHLSEARDLLADSPMPDDTLLEEAEWFAQSIEMLDDRDDNYNRKRMAASRSKTTRGHRERTVGGEVDGEDRR